MLSSPAVLWCEVSLWLGCSKISSVVKLIEAPQNIFNGVTLFDFTDMHIQEFEEKVISQVIFIHPMVWGV